MTETLTSQAVIYILSYSANENGFRFVSISSFEKYEAQLKKNFVSYIFTVPPFPLQF